MRDLIVSRIKELLTIEEPLSVDNYRYRNYWYDSNLVMHSGASNKTKKALSLKHISELDFANMSDADLVRFLEIIVRRTYTQMG